MKDLIERLEKATEPSRYNDRSIHVYLVENGLDADGPDKGCHPLLDNVPHYTASLDAAMTLVPKGHDIKITQASGPDRTDWYATCKKRDEWGSAPLHGANAFSGAVALCIAALCALSQQQGGK